MSQEFCVNSLIAQVVNGYVRERDFSELITTIEDNMGFCELKRINPAGDNVGFQLAKTICCTKTEVVCEFWGSKIGIVSLENWNTVFSRWVSDDDGEWSDYFEGFRCSRVVQ